MVVPELRQEFLQGGANCLYVSDQINAEQVSNKHSCLFFFLIFIVAPYILIYVEVTHQQMHFYYFKIYIKIHISIAPTCFGLRPSSESLHWTRPKLYLC